MASGNPKPWGGGIGNWALEAERAEAEERAAAEAAVAEPQSFPSLKEAAKTKTKKKKGTTLSLSEFATGTYVGPGGGRQQQPSSIFEPKRLTTDELMRLPTGPKDRTPEELEQGRLGGGFRNYGSYGGGASRAGGGPQRGDEDGSWGQGGGRRSYIGGFEEEARRGPPSRASDFEQMPSRADEVDNWAVGKRSLALAETGMRESRDRYQDLGGGGGTMRADDVDNWSVGKKPMPVRSSGFGSGFRESAVGMDSERWSRGGGTLNNGERERPRLVLDPPRREGSSGSVSAASEPAKAKSNPFGSARPREEVLAEKGVDWKKADSILEVKKSSRPTSSQSSRPSSAHSGVSEMVTQVVNIEVKSRPKVNPFGDAKPREVLLEERGKDWMKIDMELEHRAVGRPETEQEKLLKEEIEHLKKDITVIGEVKLSAESTEHAEEVLAGLREQVLVRERELEQLIHDLDDKVRFGQKTVSERRPGSGGGRSGTITDRPPSRSSISEESRSTDFAERPRSRGGTGDMWSHPDERRGFHTGREGGFFGSKDMDRQKIRERW